MFLDLVMGVLFEVIFDGSIEIVKAKTLPVWLRAIAAIFLASAFVLIITLIGYVAIFFMNKFYNIPTILFFLLDAFLIMHVFRKVKSCL